MYKLESMVLEAETVSALMIQMADDDVGDTSFAVMSDLGENGTEHECDLGVHTTALRASAVIDALLAELEARDKRISELSVGKVGNALLERENHHVEVVDKLLERIAELEAYNAKLRDWNAGLAQESCELQAKLATPVRLPGMMFIKVSGSAVPVMHGERVKERIRAAGFTVEGDE